MKQTTVLLENLGFPEGPRWHEGKLWFSDFRTRKISTVDLDEKSLVVGETYASRLTTFDIAADGICLDAEGAIWVASPGRGGEVLRVFKGGKIADRIQVETLPYACMLGGPDGKTLFILTSDLAREGLVGRIETVQVQTPKAGYP